MSHVIVYMLMFDLCVNIFAFAIAPASDSSVRLISINDNSQEGIVEIAYDGRWGMVCDDGFTITDARSVCQGLGYGDDDATTMTITNR